MLPRFTSGELTAIGALIVCMSLNITFLQPADCKPDPVLKKPGHSSAVSKQLEHCPVIIELSDRIPMAKNAGMMIGDQLLSIEGTPVSTAEEAIRIIHLHRNNTVKIVVRRKLSTLPISVAVNDEGKIGVRISDENHAIVSAHDGDSTPIFPSAPELEKMSDAAQTDRAKPRQNKAKQHVLKNGTQVKVLYEEQHIIDKQSKPTWTSKIRVGKPGVGQDNNSEDWFVISVDLKPASASQTHVVRSIARKDAQALKADMSDAEVIKILGAPGTVVGHNSYRAVESKSLRWQNEDGSFITCNFENNRLTYVSAFLLK